MSRARLDYLFHRYWENSLSAGELKELSSYLRRDPTARKEFQFRCELAVTVADRANLVNVAPAPAPVPMNRLSRRTLFGVLGGSIVAGVAAGYFGRQLVSSFSRPPQTQSQRLNTPTLVGIYGFVRITPLTGEPPAVGSPVLPGTVFTTQGTTAGVEIEYGRGNRITIGADSSAIISSTGAVILHFGCAMAKFLSINPLKPFGLSTPDAKFIAPGEVKLTVDRNAHTTQVGVQQGSLQVQPQDGTSWIDVHSGELLTVRSDGKRHKAPCPETSDSFAWDLSRPLPDNWWVGQRELTLDGPVVRTRQWYDPYHSTEMWQIRSDQAWNRGHVLLWPDSIIRARYRVKRPGMSQVVLVVRAMDPSGGRTGCLEINGAFDRTDPDRWHIFEARAETMLRNRHRPDFSPPWLSFITIFNTFEVDLGLEVAEFRVHRAGNNPRTI